MADSLLYLPVHFLFKNTLRPLMIPVEGSSNSRVSFFLSSVSDPPPPLSAMSAWTAPWGLLAGVSST